MRTDGLTGTTSTGKAPGVTRTSLRSAAIWCLVAWAAVWGLFALIRFSGFDIRVIPGIGPVMLVALVLSIVGPAVAIVLVAISLLQRPRATLSWLVLGGAVAACIAVAILFSANQWL